MYKSMLANRGRFASSFLIWVLFISFSCLIPVARTSNTILNNSGYSEHPCFVPDLREKSAFIIVCNISRGFVMHSVNYAKACSFYIHFIKRFYHKTMLNF